MCRLPVVLVLVVFCVAVADATSKTGRSFYSRLGLLRSMPDVCALDSDLFRRHSTVPAFISFSADHHMMFADKLTRHSPFLLRPSYSTGQWRRMPVSEFQQIKASKAEKRNKTVKKKRSRFFGRRKSRGGMLAKSYDNVLEVEMSDPVDPQFMPLCSGVTQPLRKNFFFQAQSEQHMKCVDVVFTRRIADCIGVAFLYAPRVDGNRVVTRIAMIHYKADGPANSIDDLAKQYPLLQPLTLSSDKLERRNVMLSNAKFTAEKFSEYLSLEDPNEQLLDDIFVVLSTGSMAYSSSSPTFQYENAALVYLAMGFKCENIFVNPIPTKDEDEPNNMALASTFGIWRTGDGTVAFGRMADSDIF